MDQLQEEAEQLVIRLGEKTGERATAEQIEMMAQRYAQLSVELAKIAANRRSS